MEKKTTQRIVGILVIVALVIIIMPLLLDKNDAIGQVAALKAPPFPEQPASAETSQLASADQTDSASSIEIPSEIADKINKANDSELAVEANGSVQPLKTAKTNTIEAAPQSNESLQAASPSATENTKTSTANASVDANAKTVAKDKNENDLNAAIDANAAAATKDSAKPTVSNSTPMESPKSGLSAAQKSEITKTADGLSSTQESAATSTVPTIAEDKSSEVSDSIIIPSSDEQAASLSKADSSSIDTHADHATTDTVAKPIATAPTAVKKITPAVEKKLINSKENLKAKALQAASIPKESHADIKASAWAIQLGSFKNKDNAVKLTDKLRASGYQAFMREVKSKRGELQTRVYIGPEYKVASLNKLSSQIEEKLNLHGFIVSYKPFEL